MSRNDPRSKAAQTGQTSQIPPQYSSCCMSWSGFLRKGNLRLWNPDAGPREPQNSRQNGGSFRNHDFRPTDCPVCRGLGEPGLEVAPHELGFQVSALNHFSNPQGPLLGPLELFRGRTLHCWKKVDKSEVRASHRKPSAFYSARCTVTPVLYCTVGRQRRSLPSPGRGAAKGAHIHTGPGLAPLRVPRGR